MRNVSHVVLPTIISEPGNYLTRCGEIVNIESIIPNTAYGACGKYPNQVEDRWDVCGRLYPSILSNNDIVKKI